MPMKSFIIEDVNGKIIGRASFTEEVAEELSRTAPMWSMHPIIQTMPAPQRVMGFIVAFDPAKEADRG